MNLNRFRGAFSITDELNCGNQSAPDFEIKNLGTTLQVLGGKTFNHGLYRVLCAEQVPDATLALENVFPEFRGRIVPFAFDWLGRHFACDRKRVENGEPQVLLLEVGAGEAAQIPTSVLDFHNAELTQYADDALAAPFWREWRKHNLIDLKFTDCVGYKVPLFLGGPDNLTNLEVIDLRLYVEICGQLRRKVRTLPPGQSIRSVFFDR